MIPAPTAIFLLGMALLPFILLALERAARNGLGALFRPITAV